MTKESLMPNLAFIGAGHIAGYMLQGFARAGFDQNICLFDPDRIKADALCRDYSCTCAPTCQAAVDTAGIVILAVRPQDLATALAGISFRPDQILASVVAGADMATLAPLAAPARAARVLPVSCVAVNLSPVLVHPDLPELVAVFRHLGQVHVLPDETCFTPGTALVGAFYAWIFLLMDEAAAWSRDQGFDPATARDLVVQTVQGACAMAACQSDMGLDQIWQTLATPGGISEHGARILNQKSCIHAWSEALGAITQKMQES